jgi:hypothetical protein
MINIPLPNNRLILNGHRIFTKEQLFLYLSKKLKTEVSKEQEIQELLSTYKELKIAIWHGDTFLQEENSGTQDMILKVLRNCGEVKITGRHLKN